jgi:hypothetical protein
MALLGDNPNPATAAVEAEIKKMGPKDFAGLPDLDGEDLQLIGTLIQCFSFMDLNLRRALETFHTEAMLPKEYVKLWPTNLPDSKLTEALAAIVTGMDPEKEKIEDSLLWIKVIDSTRLKRNLVGHFAGTRYKGHDVYVFASKSFKDARKVLGTGLAEYEVHLVVTPRPEFVEMVQSAKNAHEWLAKKVPEWNDRYLRKKPG